MDKKNGGRKLFIIIYEIKVLKVPYYTNFEILFYIQDSRGAALHDYLPKKNPIDLQITA